MTQKATFLAFLEESDNLIFTSLKQDIVSNENKNMLIHEEDIEELLLDDSSDESAEADEYKQGTDFPTSTAESETQRNRSSTSVETLTSKLRAKFAKFPSQNVVTETRGRGSTLFKSVGKPKLSVFAQSSHIRFTDSYVKQSNFIERLSSRSQSREKTVDGVKLPLLKNVSSQSLARV